MTNTTPKTTIDPATWTDTDREIIDKARQLDAEQLTFLLNVMTCSSKSKKAADFITANLDNYRLTTTEGRAAFLAAIQDL